MNLNDRQQAILQLINKNREAKVVELKNKFQVTEMTIRRDLEKLEKAGELRRVFGGAILANQDIALQERTEKMQIEKEQIGRAASDLVLDGESIFIDAGSTTLQVAKHLDPSLKITVVTNAINVASELLKKNIQTILIGGVLLEKTSSTAGPSAINQISELAFDRVFLGASGFNLKHGFSNTNLYEAEIKRTVIEQANQVNILVDHSKFGANYLVSFTSLKEVDQMITDKNPEESIIKACEEENVRLFITR